MIKEGKNGASTSGDGQTTAHYGAVDPPYERDYSPREAIPHVL